jgi:hypothetical protein
VDGNGLVNSSDCAVLKSVFLHKATLTDIQAKAADVDGSAIVNTTDYLRIRAHYCGKFDLYE